MDALKDKCAIISNGKEIDVYLDSFNSSSKLIASYKECVKAKYGQIEGSEYILIDSFLGLAKNLEFFWKTHPDFDIAFSGAIGGTGNINGYVEGVVTDVPNDCLAYTLLRLK